VSNSGFKVYESRRVKCSDEDFAHRRYVGDSSGSVSLLKLDLAQRCLADMPYWIPFAESYGMLFSRVCELLLFSTAYIWFRIIAYSSKFRY
jgi:hypothetical protein